MPDSPPAETSSQTGTVPRSRPLIWLGGAIFALTLTALIAAHLPDRVKLLGLFSIIWGGLAGAGLSWWAEECRLNRSRWLLSITFLLLALGEAGIVLEAWRVHRGELQKKFSKDPSAGFLQLVQTPQSNLTAEEIEVRKQVAADVQRAHTLRRQALSLPPFLRRRLKALGDWPTPWPELFWSGEILLGSLCGTWVMRQRPAGPFITHDSGDKIGE